MASCRRSSTLSGRCTAMPGRPPSSDPGVGQEPHLLHYQVLPDKPEHLGIEMHYDGCDVTWSLMLSDSADYDGGGTYIRCLRRTIMLRQGQILIHPGELYHCGNAVKTGTRSLMVCVSPQATIALLLPYMQLNLLYFHYSFTNKASFYPFCLCSLWTGMIPT